MVDGEHAKLLLHYRILEFCYIGKLAYLSMPKFLIGCHYNEEEISRHLKRNIGYWPVQSEGNKFATGEILKKTGRSCEGANFTSCLSSNVSRTLPRIDMNKISTRSPISHKYMTFFWISIVEATPNHIPVK